MIGAQFLHAGDATAQPFSPVGDWPKEPRFRAVLRRNRETARAERSTDFVSRGPI